MQSEQVVDGFALCRFEGSPGPPGADWVLNIHSVMVYMFRLNHSEEVLIKSALSASPGVHTVALLCLSSIQTPSGTLFALNAGLDPAGGGAGSLFIVGPRDPVVAVTGALVSLLDGAAGAEDDAQRHHDHHKDP